MFLAFIIAGIVLGVMYTALMLWYLYGWLRTPVFKTTPPPPQTRVSIIIAARNEEKNIGACLDSILKQNYPAHLFEVIVVDDHSNDSTVAIAGQYERVKLLPLASVDPTPNPSPKREGNPNDYKSPLGDLGVTGKKKAIEKGIEVATGSLIITTDADCTSGPEWLATIVAYYETYKPAMIAAPVYFNKVNGPLAIWQVLDFAGLMGITAAGIKFQFPQMCNGANLAYEKSAFQQVSGFNGIDGVPTGDDILLMLKMAWQFPNRVCFVKSADAIIYTSPQPTLSSLVSQRLRWVSKSKVFTDQRINAVLIVSWLFNFVILSGLIASLFWPGIFRFALMLLFFKTLFELPLVYFSLRLSSQTRYLWHLPWVLFLHLIYVVIIGPASLISKYEWKGRKY